VRRPAGRLLRSVTLPLLAALTASVISACSGSNPQAGQPPPLSSLLPKPVRSSVTPPPSGAVIKTAVEAFIDGLNEAFRTGDISAAENASTSTCNCRDQLTKIAETYRKHFVFVGTRLVVLRILPTTLGSTQSQARVVARIPQSAIENAKGKKRILKAHKAEPVLFTLKNDGGRWLVSSIGAPTGTPVPKPS
jgi:hypothetical protein